MLPLRSLHRSYPLLLPQICESMPKRSTVVFKRRFPVRLYKLDGPLKKTRSSDFVYDIVRDTFYEPKPNIDVILTSYVEGVGQPGDVVSVRPFGGYDKYIIPGLATYATPENIAKYSELAKNSEGSRTFSSKYSYKTLKLLAFHVIAVQVNDAQPWTLRKSNLRTAFRLNGYVVPEDAIVMPERVISGPEKEQHRKEFYVTVTISPTERVKVRCRLYLVGIHSEPAPIGDHIDTCEPLFEEDREVLNSMPTMKQHPAYSKMRMRYNR